jgi:hypothetical protein
MAEPVLVDPGGKEWTPGTPAEAANLKARGYKPKKQAVPKATPTRVEPKQSEGEK